MDTCNHILYKFLTVIDGWKDPEVVWIPFIIIRLDLDTGLFQDMLHNFAIVAEGIELACSNVSWWILGEIFT
jgi:hypothetical protein